MAGGKGLALVADAMSRTDGERVVDYRHGTLRSHRHPGEQRRRLDVRKRFLDITDEDFRHTFDWCVTSAFIMSQLVAPHMIEAGRGTIVNISSGAGAFRHPCIDGVLRRQGRP